MLYSLKVPDKYVSYIVLQSGGLGCSLGICTKISTCCKSLFFPEGTDPNFIYKSTEYARASRCTSSIHVLGNSGLIFTAVSYHRSCVPLNCKVVYHHVGMSLYSAFKRALRK